MFIEEVQMLQIIIKKLNNNIPMVIVFHSALQHHLVWVKVEHYLSKRQTQETGKMDIDLVQELQILI